MTKKRILSVSKRKALRMERARKQRQQRITALFIIIGIALLVVAILVYPSIQRAIKPVGEFVKITPNPRPLADFNAMGDPNAPVKIIEFSDFQCPYCKRFSDETANLIIDTYVVTGKVYFRYVPYGPGGNYIGPESKDAAMAAFCAGAQGKFWEYHDILFANHTGENVGDYTQKRLVAFAESLGLNLDQFNACFNNNEYEQKLQDGIAEGKQAQVGGTPAFLINGKLSTGALPFETFQQEIEAALQAAGG